VFVYGLWCLASRAPPQGVSGPKGFPRASSRMASLMNAAIFRRLKLVARIVIITCAAAKPRTRRREELSMFSVPPFLIWLFSDSIELRAWE
jgi:hypothetical protein